MHEARRSGYGTGNSSFGAALEGTLAARRRDGWRRRLFSTTALGSVLLMTPAATWANPADGVVVGGKAVIQHAPGVTTIDQASRRALINWKEFSIAPGELTQFRQPGTDAIALNRVVGNNASQIMGALKANGQVWLINPNGILFGPGARIDVHGILATTTDIADRDFMAGRYDFNRPSPDHTASVVNQGAISIGEKGLGALVAPHVRNDGVIAGKLGQVVLAGAETFTLDFHGDGLVQFAATSEVKEALEEQGAIVSNDGTISAEGGTVLITAAAASDVVDEAINVSGIVEAKSVAMKDGAIVLDGGDDGIVHVAGTLDASGGGAGEKGGSVKVLGEKVGLFDGARIDASGEAGGGEVLIGGNYQGKGPERNAERTVVFEKATVKADALRDGDGGRVIVWSDEGTRFEGTISARGGSEDGDGGFVEVSGLDNLVFQGKVDTSAEAGQAGTLLLDPINITISESETNSITETSGDPFVFSSSDDFANLAVVDLVEQLDGGQNVVVRTGSAGSQEGSIFIDAPIIAPDDYAGTLLFEAFENIVINASVDFSQATAASVLGFFADAIESEPGDIGGISGPGVIIMGPGSLKFSAGAIAFDGEVDLPAINVTTQNVGNLAAATAGDFILTNSGTGDINITQVDAVSGVRASQNVNITTTAGGLTISAVDDSGPSLQSENGSINLNVAGNVIQNPGGNIGAATDVSINADSNVDGVGAITNPGQATITLGRNIFLSAGEGIGDSPADAPIPVRTIIGPEPEPEPEPGDIGSIFISAVTTTGGIRIENVDVVGEENDTVFLSPQDDSPRAIFAPEGDIAIRNLVGDISVNELVESGQNVTLEAQNSIILNAPVVASGIGTSIILNTQGFVNNFAGEGSALEPGPGRFLVYSVNPANDIRNVPQEEFSKRYNFPFDPGDPTGSSRGLPPTGDFFLYQIAPELTLAVNPDSATREYGDPNPVFAVGISGLIDGDTSADALSATTVAVAPPQETDVGTYTVGIGPEGLTSPLGYTLIPRTGALTITPAPLSIQAGDASRAFSVANPAFTASFAGFKLEEGPEVIAGLQFSTPAIPSSPPGEYPVVPFGATAPNYSISFASGTLTIEDIPPQIPNSARPRTLLSGLDTVVPLEFNPPELNIAFGIPQTGGLAEDEDLLFSSGGNESFWGPSVAP